MNNNLRPARDAAVADRLDPMTRLRGRWHLVGGLVAGCSWGYVLLVCLRELAT